MSIYSIHPDPNESCRVVYDWKQVRSQLGYDYRFDMDRTVKPYSQVWKEPIGVRFRNDTREEVECPDIAVDQGRLIFNQKAFDALSHILQGDGEFLSVQCEVGKCYVFNPLCLAEDVDGLDTDRSVKDEWGEAVTVIFHEDTMKVFAAFKTGFDRFSNIYCQQSLKDAVESAELNGVVFIAQPRQDQSSSCAPSVHSPSGCEPTTD